MNSNLNSATSLAARILLATLFLISGFGKIAAPAATKAYIAYAGMPVPDLAYIVAILVEVGVGLALVVGYRTRPAAVILAIYAVVTALVFHHNFADQNQMFNFLKNISIAGGLLQVVAFGAGAYSLDARRGRTLKPAF